MSDLAPSYRTDEGGHYATKLLPAGRMLAVDPLTYDRARLYVGPQGQGYYDDGW